MFSDQRALDLRYLRLTAGTSRAIVKRGGDTWFFLTADYAFMAIAVPPGAHEIAITFHTPGTLAGAGVSLACAALLALLVWRNRRDCGTLN